MIIKHLHKKRERNNVKFHYDLPIDFYKAYLGKYEVYTCAYYKNDKTSLDDAQYAKLDIICKKLRLEKNEKLLDIGFGFGSLIFHAIKNYGVTATGISLSKTQLDYVQHRIKQEKLQDKCKVILLNYRDLPKEFSKNHFDKVSCVGMSEHVGIRHIGGFFKTVYSVLKEDGLFLNHTGTTWKGMEYGPANKFMNKYIFPGCELLKIYQLTENATKNGFEVLSSENIGLHYAKTLKDWIIEMQKNKEKLIKIAPESVYRAYTIFFAACSAAYKNGDSILYQDLYYKRGPNRSKNLDLFYSGYLNK